MVDLGACPPISLHEPDDGEHATIVAAALWSEGDFVRNEVRHRFHNLVAVVQSLVNQTLRDGATIADARETLNRQLGAMGGALDLLLRTDWRPSPLRGLVDEALGYPLDFRSRVHCDGPDLSVCSHAAVTLTLALHELQTNAIKYGALSSPDGTVELFWKVVDGPAGPRLWMQWAERNGPAVLRPALNGSGTRLIVDATRRSLGGDVAVEYTAGGLVWLLLAPLDRIAA